jgi:hypothetical protein
MVSEICVILKKNLPVGDGDDPGSQLVGHLICLFTLIINIYGLRPHELRPGVIPIPYRKVFFENYTYL